MALFDRYTKYDYNEKDYRCRSGQVWKCDNQYLIIDDVLNIETGKEPELLTEVK